MVVWHTSFQGEEPWMRDAGFNRIIMYTHVCEKKGPASATSASALEVASVFLGICRFVSVLFMLWEQTGELKDLNLAAVRL